MNSTSKISIEETHCYLMYQINLRYKHQFSIPAVVFFSFYSDLRYVSFN